MTERNRDDLLAFVEKPIRMYEKTYECDVELDITLLDECFSRAETSLQKQFSSFQAPNGYDPSPFKMAGTMCFWIRKLKPARTKNNDFEKSLVY